MHAPSRLHGLSGLALLLAAGDVPRESAAPIALASELPSIPHEAAAAPLPEEELAIPNHPALTSRFFFGIGGYFASTTTEVRLDSPSGIGTSVSMEEILGLDDRNWSVQGLARWRMSERWRLEAEHFDIDRSNSRALTADLTWGDETFPAGTTVDVLFDVAVTRVSVGYSFFKRQDKEIGVALGFHVTSIDAEISSTGGAEDGGDVLAPLPVLSLYGQFALTDHWAVAGRMDAFQLTYDPYQGHLYSVGLDAVWNPWRHVGLGIGWRSLQIAVSAEDNDWEGEIDTNFQGPIAFLSVYF